jgi:hypothetical protein
VDRQAQERKSLSSGKHLSVIDSQHQVNRPAKRIIGNKLAISGMPRIEWRPNKHHAGFQVADLMVWIGRDPRGPASWISETVAVTGIGWVIPLHPSFGRSDRSELSQFVFQRFFGALPIESGPADLPKPRMEEGATWDQQIAHPIVRERPRCRLRRLPECRATFR